MSIFGAVIEIHEDVTYIETSEDVVEVIEVYNWGSAGDSIEASLATEEGQIPVSLGASDWSVIPPPPSSGLVMSSDLGVAGKVVWAAGGEAGAHTLDSHTSPSDITDNDVSVDAHGLCPKLPDDETKYFNGVGEWSAAAGDMVGPAASTDHAIVRYDGVTGKLVQNSAATCDDTTGMITAPIKDKGGQVYNVKAWGAVGDGSTDDTAAIQAAIDALPDNGGVVYLPSGTYKLTSTLVIGNGNGTGYSTKNGVTFKGDGMGSTLFWGNSYEGATILQWSGASGGAVLKLNGAIDGCVLRDFSINGNQLATIMLDIQRAHLLRVENITGYKYQGGFPVVIHNAGAGPIIGPGHSEQTWINVHMSDPYGSSANGLDIAPYESGVGNVCEVTFISCSFARSAIDSSIGVRFGYCDHITFLRTYFLRQTGNTGIGIQVEPVTGYAAYPQNIVFLGSPFLGGIKYVNTVPWTTTAYPALIFHPFYSADGQIVPPSYQGSNPLPDNLCAGETDDQRPLGKLPTNPWTAPTLLNSWANFGGVYSTAGYYQDRNNIVHLKGLVRAGSVGGYGIFTLPAGYRPATQKIFATISHNGASALIAQVEVSAAGAVIAQVGGNYWFTLDGITFRAEA